MSDPLLIDIRRGLNQDREFEHGLFLYNGTCALVPGRFGTSTEPEDTRVYRPGGIGARAFTLRFRMVSDSPRSHLPSLPIPATREAESNTNKTQLAMI